MVMVMVETYLPENYEDPNLNRGSAKNLRYYLQSQKKTNNIYIHEVFQLNYKLINYNKTENNEEVVTS